MDLDRVVSVLTALLPVLVPLGMVLYRVVLSRLPEAQRARAEREVRLAVAAVEQLYRNVPGAGPQKKAEVVRLALDVLGLRVSPARLDLLVEAAVAALPPRDAPQSPA